MDSFEYLIATARSESVKEKLPNESDLRLLHASLGMHTEAAEFADMLKKHIFHGANLDRINALEEIGDLLWYIAIVLRFFNSNFQQVMEANIAKLQFRYPEEFNEINAVVRELQTEREILEKILQFSSPLQ